MMAADDNDGVADDVQSIPSHVFDSVNSPVSAKLGGWATGAGSALFAVTKVRIAQNDVGRCGALHTVLW